MDNCPECGRAVAADAAVCTNCGHALANGVVPSAASYGRKPPPEVCDWVIEKTPPEMIEEALRTFNEVEFLAKLREVETTGGVKFEEIIGGIEDMVKRSE